MPNWCSNTITITGSEKTIALLRRVIENTPKDDDSPGLFETLIGKNPDITEEKYKEGGWYSANCDWYGCKWDIGINEYQFDFTDSCISFGCDTAWSPPTMFLENLCKMYKVQATIQYYEPGCDFAGQMSFDEGGVTEQEDYEYMEGLYRFDNEQFWNEVTSNFEYDSEDENTTAEIIANRYPFLDKSEKQEVINLYEEYLEENKKELKDE